MPDNYYPPYKVELIRFDSIHYFSWIYKNKEGISPPLFTNDMNDRDYFISSSKTTATFPHLPSFINS